MLKQKIFGISGSNPNSLLIGIFFVPCRQSRASTRKPRAGLLCMSGANFQRIFHLVTDITIGSYIRNRRLSLAGWKLFLTDNRIIDTAMQYQYDTSESFSKAFTRFHGIPPSVVKKYGDKLKCFSPLTINIFIRGGFNMSRIVNGK